MRHFHQPAEPAADGGPRRTLVWAKIILLRQALRAVTAAGPGINDTLIPDRDTHRVRLQLGDLTGQPHWATSLGYPADNFVRRRSGEHQPVILDRQHPPAVQVIAAAPKRQVRMTHGAMRDRDHSIGAGGRGIR